MDVQQLEPKIPKKQPKKHVSDVRLNADNAYRITESLAFPRLVGSEGEKKAINIILNEFKKTKCTPISQDSFKTSFYNWIVTKYLFFPFTLEKK